MKSELFLSSSIALARSLMIRVKLGQRVGSHRGERRPHIRLCSTKVFPDKFILRHKCPWLGTHARYTHRERTVLLEFNKLYEIYLDRIFWSSPNQAIFSSVHTAIRGRRIDRFKERHCFVAFICFFMRRAFKKTVCPLDSTITLAIIT